MPDESTPPSVRPPTPPAPAARAPLDAGRLAALLPGWAVEVTDATPSTNADLAARARAGAGAGTVLVTEHQTAGRGRLDRGWETPRGAALTFSALLRPELPPAAWPWLPLLTGLAVVDGLRSWSTGAGVALPAGLKWPNDVLVDDAGVSGGAGRKLCGILLERVETATGPAAVLGVGLNTGLTEAELPVPAATSVLVETGIEPDRTDLLAAVLGPLGERYAALVRSAAASGGASGPVRDAYRAACLTLGRPVRVELPGERTLSGEAVDVDAEGRLVVAPVGGGAPVAVGAGDVVHVRVRDAGEPDGCGGGSTGG